MVLTFFQFQIVLNRSLWILSKPFKWEQLVAQCWSPKWPSAQCGKCAGAFWKKPAWQIGGELIGCGRAFGVWCVCLYCLYAVWLGGGRGGGGGGRRRRWSGFGKIKIGVVLILGEAGQRGAAVRLQRELAGGWRRF